MRTPEEWLAVLALACAVRGARDVRQVYEEGAEPGPPAWGAAWGAAWGSAWGPPATPLAGPARPPPAWRDAPPLAYEPNPLSLRRRTVYRLRSGAGVGRVRLAGPLLTFGAQDPDPRLLAPLPILVVRQLSVDASDDPPPLRREGGGDGGELPRGLLTFDASPPPQPTSTTPRPWWRSPPPVQLAVRPRLGDGGAAETLAVGASPLVARLHGPVAMGSGGVGYARLPDGRLAIGSGSIGFAQFDVFSLVN